MSATRRRNTVVVNGRILTNAQGKLSQEDMVAELLQKGCRISLKTYQKCVREEPVDRMTASRIADALDLSFEEFLKPKPGTTDADLYLNNLENQCRYIDPKGLIIGGEVIRFPIKDAFIHLTVKGDELPTTERAAPQRTRPATLEELLGHDENPLVVVTGLPGSGKSTFLRWLAYDHCRSGKRFPILIGIAGFEAFIRTSSRGLPETKTASADWLPLYLADPRRGFGLDAAFFRNLLQGRNALVLCDGLDEVQNPDQRARIARWFEAATKTYKDAHFVVTTRPTAYQGTSTLAGFREVPIGELDDDAKFRFLGQWAAMAHPGDAAGEAAFRDGLINALRDPAAQAANNLASNPLMLTAIAVIYHHLNKRLPDNRADLYEAILKWLAGSREVGTAAKRLSNLETLALKMQFWPGGRVTTIDMELAATLIAEESGGVDVAAKERELVFLEDELNASGIIVDRRGPLEFAHLTYQEFLAAKALISSERTAELSKEERWQLTEWREVFLLVPAILLGQNRKVAIRGIIDSILSRAESVTATQEIKARAVDLIGAILGDIRSGYEYQDRPRYEKLLEEVREILPSLSPRLRVDAAEVIDRADIPRLNAGTWVYIPGGTFTMGAQSTRKNRPGYDPEATDKWEGPVEADVEVGPFQIGRYPVTVREFQAFVEDRDRGYSVARHWEPGKFAADEPEPSGWTRQVTHPNRPVVNVSWYAADAYCRWLTEKEKGKAREGDIHWIYQLPTQKQWEFAARGPQGRKYPWGDEPADLDRANYIDTRIHAPSPVGLFPRGATPNTDEMPGGLDDMAGNVFEWTNDWYDNEKKYRVLRGGCWCFFSRNLRAAVRYGFGPAVRFDYVGFRVVREA